MSARKEKMSKPDAGGPERNRQVEDSTRRAFEGVFFIQEGRVVFCNESFARMAGYDADEIQTWSREQLHAIVHPSDREHGWLRPRHIGSAKLLR